MFAQTIASVFSASGIHPIQRYPSIQSKPEDKTPVSTQINQTSSIVDFSQNAENMLAASKIAGVESKDNKSKNGKNELTEEEKKRVEDLKKRDREVKNSYSNSTSQNTTETLKPESDLYSKKASSPEFEYANSGIKGYNRFPAHEPGELINMFA